MPLDAGATARGQFLPSACPHDCPSTCALEVERLGKDQIGRVRGAADNDYTLGVICAKVARYRERLIQEFPESAEAESLNTNVGSR